MKYIITENQLSTYVRRRIVCFEDFMNRLEEGEKLFPMPRRQLNWDDFKILIGKIITGIKEISLPDDYVYPEEPSYNDCISPHLYEIRFKDSDESLKFLLVNYSNGYYDGWINTEII